MKALLLSDEINQFHWTVLKSVLLILSLLPVSHFLLELWQTTDGSSQIMVGFMSISVFSALSIISFYSSLKATVLKFVSLEHSDFEARVVQLYRYVPMLSLMTMISYLTTQLVF